MDLSDIMENLPSSNNNTNQQQPSVLITKQEDYPSCIGIDPELERLLDNDPGLMDIKRCRSFQPPGMSSYDDYASGVMPAWYSLPDETNNGGGGGKARGGFANHHGSLLSPCNVVEKVKSQAVKTTR